jgi:hypothetical protein
VACKEISTKSHEHYLWIVSQIIFLPFCTEPDPTLRIRGNVYPEKNIGYVEVSPFVVLYVCTLYDCTLYRGQLC